MLKKLSFLFILFAALTLNAGAQIKEVNAKEVKTILGTEKGWTVIDVRTPAEFKEGHVPGALNIDIHQDDAFTKIGKLKKDGKYIVYCRTKNRSGVAADYMVKNGFKTVYQMIDGIGGWNSVQ
ncbi:MAG TPA: rhodanese-like domain-containing protein [Bacteroidales bacterium]|nr:rhodanese-like domain-containing protein [Bacteroidales bacterium]